MTDVWSWVCHFLALHCHWGWGAGSFADSFPLCKVGMKIIPIPWSLATDSVSCQAGSPQSHACLRSGAMKAPLFHQIFVLPSQALWAYRLAAPLAPCDGWGRKADPHLDELLLPHVSHIPSHFKNEEIQRQIPVHLLLSPKLSRATKARISLLRSSLLPETLKTGWE